jgi:predicted nuclease of restriction endonuclease-like RecB superfamily
MPGSRSTMVMKGMHSAQQLTSTGKRHCNRCCQLDRLLAGGLDRQLGLVKMRERYGMTVARFIFVKRKKKWILIFRVRLASRIVSVSGVNQ